MRRENLGVKSAKPKSPFKFYHFSEINFECNQFFEGNETIWKMLKKWKFFETEKIKFLFLIGCVIGLPPTISGKEKKIPIFYLIQIETL